LVAASGSTSATVASTGADLIGQAQRAFIQGYGWLTMEALVWYPKTGALLTHAPSTYKIPTANDSPARFVTALFESPNPADTIHRSKASCEPLLPPFSALRRRRRRRRRRCSRLSTQ
jgi:xanthine dehydrogenase molybdopterin-binding subunit B